MDNLCIHSLHSLHYSNHESISALGNYKNNILPKRRESMGTLSRWQGRGTESLVGFGATPQQTE